MTTTTANCPRCGHDEITFGPLGSFDGPDEIAICDRCDLTWSLNAAPPSRRTDCDCLCCTAERAHVARQGNHEGK